MDMMTAFLAMAGDITAVNASRRQVAGILSWHDRARIAGGLAREHGFTSVVAFAGSRTHRTWRASGQSILDALAAQAEEAARRRIAAELGARREEAAAAAAGAAAAGAHARAAAAAEAAEAARASAGGCARPEDAAVFLAQAAAAEAAAQAAEAEAAALAGEAEAHRIAAERARQLAARMREWEIAARDAHGTGAAVLRAEEPRALRLGELVTRAGPREIPRDKGYLTTTGRT